MNYNDIQLEWTTGVWRKDYKNFVINYDEGGRRKRRLGFLKTEIMRYERNISRSQDFVDYLLDKNAPTWLIEIMTEMHDVILTIRNKLGGEDAVKFDDNRLMFKGIGGYFIDKWNGKLKIDCGQNLKGKIKKLNRLKFELDLLGDNRNIENIDIDRIRRAKLYPIDRLMEFKKDFAICIFHKEKTPSMKLYRDTNKVHCFGCGMTVDSIDITQKVYNLNFKEAINYLIK